MKKYKNYAQKCNRLLIVDFEATCYEDGVFPAGETQEPIEFGLAMLSIEHSDKGNPKVSLAQSGSILVVPAFSRVSAFCTKLTGHTYESLKRNGHPYDQACSRIRNEFHPTNIPWASWGQYDYNLWVKANGLYPSAKECFSHSHYNLSPLFAMKMGLNRKMGVERALDLFGTKFQGRPHSGIDDAKNIDRLAAWTIWGINPEEFKING